MAGYDSAAALSAAAAFLAGIWINPPYAFARQKNNLTYRDADRPASTACHQPHSATLPAGHRPHRTWPATSELSWPELGYTHISFPEPHPSATSQSKSSARLQRLPATTTQLLSFPRSGNLRQASSTSPSGINRQTHASSTSITICCPAKPLHFSTEMSSGRIAAKVSGPQSCDFPAASRRSSCRHRVAKPLYWSLSLYTGR